MLTAGVGFDGTAAYSRPRCSPSAECRSGCISIRTVPGRGIGGQAQTGNLPAVRHPDMAADASSNRCAASMLTTGYITGGMEGVCSCHLVAIQAEEAVYRSGTGIVGTDPEEGTAACAVSSRSGIRPRLVGAGQHPLDRRTVWTFGGG